MKETLANLVKNTMRIQFFSLNAIPKNNILQNNQ